MISLTDGMFAVGILASLVLWWLGYYTYRTWDEPGSNPFAAFIVLMGIGGLIGGVGSLVVSPAISEVPLWPQVGIAFFFLWSVPWALFGLQYTGRYTKIRLRTVGLLFAPFAGILVLGGVQLVTDIGGTALDPFVGGALFLYFLILVSLGLFFVLQTTYAYGHLSLRQGSSIAMAPIANFLLINTSTAMPLAADPLEVATLYVAAFAVPVGTLGLALFSSASSKPNPTSTMNATDMTCSRLTSRTGTWSAGIGARIRSSPGNRFRFTNDSSLREA